MAGKPKSTWGGIRPGAGRPARRPTMSQVEKLQKVARKYERLHHKSVDEQLLDILYAPEVSVRDRLWAIKLFKEAMTVKPGEAAPVDAFRGPAIFLPAHHPAGPAVVSAEKSEPSGRPPHQPKSR